MKKYSKKIDKCQISGKRDLKKIISLGFLPPVNKLQKIGDQKSEEIFEITTRYGGIWPPPGGSHFGTQDPLYLRLSSFWLLFLQTLFS